MRFKRRGYDPKDDEQKVLRQVYDITATKMMILLVCQGKRKMASYIENMKDKRIGYLVMIQLATRSLALVIDHNTVSALAICDDVGSSEQHTSTLQPKYFAPRITEHSWNSAG